jgi:predicted trehalose synthase
MIAWGEAKYPDATPVTNATVHAWLSAADSRVNATATYDKASAPWIVEYAFALRDLLKVRSWIL